jgi:hypothetical protein
MSRRLLTSLLTWLLACTAHATEVYSINSGDDRMTLNCAGMDVIETSCKIEVGQGTPQQSVAVRFENKPTRYPHLLKLGIEKAIDNRTSVKLDPADIPLLRGLILEKCHPSAEYSGDLIQLCVPEGASSSVVLFLRGLCDRCDFEPVILKK